MDAGLLHQAAGQRGVERRQGQGPVAEDFDQDAPSPKEEDWAELCILAGTDDQLIAIKLLHGLHGDALEMFCAAELPHRPFDGLIGCTHGVGLIQIELYPLNVRFVGDGLRIEFKDDWIADRFGNSDGLGGVGGQAGHNGGDAISVKDLLGLKLGENGPLFGPDGVDQGACMLMIDGFRFTGNR